MFVQVLQYLSVAETNDVGQTLMAIIITNNKESIWKLCLPPLLKDKSMYTFPVQ